MKVTLIVEDAGEGRVECRIDPVFWGDDPKLTLAQRFAVKHFRRICEDVMGVPRDSKPTPEKS